jgi:hypothetical protein
LYIGRLTTGISRIRRNWLGFWEFNFGEIIKTKRNKFSFIKSGAFRIRILRLDGKNWDEIKGGKIKKPGRERLERDIEIK